MEQKPSGFLLKFIRMPIKQTGALQFQFNVKTLPPLFCSELDVLLKATCVLFFFFFQLIDIFSSSVLNGESNKTEPGTARSYYKANDKISIKNLKLNWEKVDFPRARIKKDKIFATKKAEKIIIVLDVKFQNSTIFQLRLCLPFTLFPIYQTVFPSGSEWHNALKCT